MRALDRPSTSERERLLGELYETHALRALRFAYVLTGSEEVAEDLVQEAFVRTFGRLDELRERDAFPGYLRTTILNLARAYFRRRRVEQLSLRRHAVLHPGTDVESPDLDQRTLFWHLLQRIPNRQRAVLVLRYYEDLSEKDAAEALGTSVGAVKALAARGTAALRKELHEKRGG